MAEAARPRPWGNWQLLATGVGAVVIYLPLALMILFSFNDSKRGAVWRGFSWRHYEAALRDDALLAAFGNSFLVAGANALLATAIGLAAALSMERFRFPLLRAYIPVFSLPLVIPEICLGIALLSFYHALSVPVFLPWPWSLGTVLVAHVTFSLPFAAMLIRGRLRQLNGELEMAGHDLGGDSWHVLRHVTIPQLMPALVAAALLSFTLSLDDFVVTFFTAGPASQLLPLKVFSMVRLGSTPVVNAVSTVLIAITFTGILLAALVMRRR